MKMNAKTIHEALLAVKERRKTKMKGTLKAFSRKNMSGNFSHSQALLKLQTMNENWRNKQQIDVCTRKESSQIE